MNLDKRMYPINHQHNRGKEHFHNPKRFPHDPFHSLLTPISTQATMHVLSITKDFILSFPEFHLNRTMQHVCVCVFFPVSLL